MAFRKDFKNKQKSFLQLPITMLPVTSYHLPVTMAANLGQRRIITDEEASGLDFQVHLARKMEIYEYLILKYKYENIKYKI